MRQSIKHFLCFITLFSISVCLLVYEYKSEHNREQYSTTFSRWASIAFTPIIRISQGTLNELKQIYQRLAYSEEIFEENRRLSTELAQLRTTLQLMESENRQYKRLLRLTSETLVAVHPKTLIPAVVTSINISPLSCTMTVNKGRIDGVEVNTPVAYGKSLVGYVISTTHSSSVVRLLNDPRTIISGVIQDSRELCVVKSRGPAHPLQLIMERTSASPQPQRLVLTSGIDTSIYPKGLVIGKIISVQKSERGEVTAELHPEVNFNRIEEVLLIIP